MIADRGHQFKVPAGGDGYLGDLCHPEWVIADKAAQLPDLDGEKAVFSVKPEFYRRRRVSIQTQLLLVDGVQETSLRWRFDFFSDIDGHLHPLSFCS